MIKINDRLRAKAQERRAAATEEENHHAFRKNYEVECCNCGEKPTVGDTELCGPCCFGEADTLGGNW